MLGFSSSSPRFGVIQHMFILHENLYLIYMNINSEFKHHLNSYALHCHSTSSVGLTSVEELYDVFPLGVRHLDGFPPMVSLRHKIS